MEITNRKLNLLILATTYPRYKDDWMGNYIHNLSKELTSKFNVNVLCPSNSKSINSEVIDNVKIKRFSYFIKRFEKLAYENGILDNIRENPFLILLIPFFTLFFVKKKGQKIFLL